MSTANTSIIHIESMISVRRNSIENLRDCYELDRGNIEIPGGGVGFLITSRCDLQIP